VGTSKTLQPFLKWAGGKRQLLNEIKRYAPNGYRTYYEPFLGGGAVLLSLQPQQGVVGDVNTELVNAYRVIRDDVDSLIEHLHHHKNDRDYFYEQRALDRGAKFKNLSPVERASRLIYLNKTCFNGLFRVNRRGQFNVPFGRYTNPNIVNEGTLRALHYYFISNDIQIQQGDFAEILSNASSGDFVYLDPPYDPVSTTSSFTSYTLSGFCSDEQIRLKETVDKLTDIGCKVMLSNSATDSIRDLYKHYRVVTVAANRPINSKANRRGKIDEVLVMNYES
jgi:DNA adenine methylase